MIETITIGSREIVIKGIGKMFYQDGFPIPMGCSLAKSMGLEVSYFHLCKELLNEWQPKTVINKIKGEFADSIQGDDKVDLGLLELFCNSEYEERQAMIFDYLYNGDISLIQETFNKTLEKYK